MTGGACEAPREHGLSYARHVLDEGVAPAEQRHDGQLDGAVLADDDLLDVLDDALRNLVRLVDALQWSLLTTDGRPL